MILRETDTLVLPDGVLPIDGALADHVRDGAYALNAAGAIVVAHDGRPLGEAIAAVEQAWGVDHDQARRDVLAFAWLLNRALLANIRRRGNPLRRAAVWLWAAVRLLPFGIVLPVLNRRVGLDTSSRLRAARGAFVASLPRSFGAAAACAVVVLPAAGLVGAPPGAVAALTAVAVVGVATHEAGHALALRGIPAALVSSGVAVSVLYRPAGPRATAVIALAGPALPAAIGLFVAVLGVRLDSVEAGILACPLAGHALTATLLGRDGRMLCRS
ncbi:MAG: PqqD family protein [Gaiellales bacterium]